MSSNLPSVIPMWRCVLVMLLKHELVSFIGESCMALLDGAAWVASLGWYAPWLVAIACTLLLWGSVQE